MLIFFFRNNKTHSCSHATICQYYIKWVFYYVDSSAASTLCIQEVTDNLMEGSKNIKNDTSCGQSAGSKTHGLTKWFMILLLFLRLTEKTTELHFSDIKSERTCCSHNILLIFWVKSLRRHLCTVTCAMSPYSFFFWLLTVKTPPPKNNLIADWKLPLVC